MPDSKISLWCRDEIVRQVVSVLWSQHILSLRADLWSDVDTRFLSMQYPYVLDDSFANYFDRMGIVMQDDNDVYGRSSRRKGKAAPVNSSNSNSHKPGPAKIELRDRPQWRYLLHHFYTNPKVLTDASIDQYQTASIPVASMKYLDRFVQHTNTRTHTSSTTTSSPALLYVQIISFCSELQLVLLVLLPFLNTSLVSIPYEHLITTATLGISLDLRSPWLIFLVVALSSVLLLMLMLRLLFSMYQLVECRSPLSRTTFEMLSALECSFLHQEKVLEELHVVPRAPSFWYKLLFAVAPSALDAVQFTANVSRYVVGSCWSFVLAFANGGLAIFRKCLLVLRVEFFDFLCAF